MIGRHSKDYTFKQQMKVAHRDTKEFINSIIRTFEINDLNQVPKSPKQILMDRQHEVNQLLAQLKEDSGNTSIFQIRAKR